MAPFAEVFSATDSGAPRRRVRLTVFSPWASRLQDGGDFLRTLPAMIMPRNPADAADENFPRLARLDCDWHGETVRALAAMGPAGPLEFLPLQVTGRAGLADFIAAVPPTDEEWWFVLTGQHPQMLAGLIGPALGVLARRGVRPLYYAFDEASRTMPAFAEIAPHLAVLIHDERPLAPAAAGLPAGCRTMHRSWVANTVPFATPLCAEPEEKIIFVGSRLGLSAHRQRQIDFLQGKFRDKFIAVTDHSLPVAARAGLARCRVGFCPEGRNFATEAMRSTHTDRPFWSGALGLVPVCEDSRWGGRLEALHQAGLILRYPHADLPALAACCEQALAAGPELRRRTHEHFNRHETIGAVVTEAITGG
jgi:hypothetical protein